MSDTYTMLWAQRVEAVEAGYEFMLAYAAQGREKDDPASEVRQFLDGMHTALEDLAERALRIRDGGDDAVAPARQRVAHLGAVVPRHLELAPLQPCSPLLEQRDEGAPVSAAVGSLGSGSAVALAAAAAAPAPTE